MSHCHTIYIPAPSDGLIIIYIIMFFHSSPHIFKKVLAEVSVSVSDRERDGDRDRDTDADTDTDTDTDTDADADKRKESEYITPCSCTLLH